MSNRKPQNQVSYYQEHPPKCIATFRVEAAQLENVGFDGHGFSGKYPDGLVEKPDIVFSVSCQCGSTVYKVVGESQYDEIWQHQNLVVAERFFLECGSCHARHLLFDRFTHGYNAETFQLEGWTLSDIIGSDPPLPVKDIVTCECSNCHHTKFEVFTRFEYPSDLFEESLFQGREQEFFSWFTGVGKCNNCARLNVFMEYECA